MSPQSQPALVRDIHGHLDFRNTGEVRDGDRFIRFANETEIKLNNLR
jgi:hypothetical protein